MSRDIREKLSQIESITTKDFSDNSLTKQENRILNMVMKGKSTGEIARELFLSINTINNHKTRIRNKLNLQSNRQLVAYVMQWRNRIYQNAY
jgi:DNA-binding CsgD family transcriptional regulator